jgi:predicted RNA-binding Zn ribbon-like protein
VTQEVESPAAQVLVGGLLLPRPLAGHPALELCNTVAGWGEDDQRDYLASYPHLVALTRHLGLRPAARARALRRDTTAVEAVRALVAVRRLRADLYAVLAHRDRSALPRLNRALARAAAARQVTALGSRGPRWATTVDDARLPGTLLAWEAHRLLTDPTAAARVRACPGHGCGWLFLDPRGQRRWCVMALCGNRAKARRHEERARFG